MPPPNRVYVPAFEWFVFAYYSPNDHDLRIAISIAITFVGYGRLFRCVCVCKSFKVSRVNPIRPDFVASVFFFSLKNVLFSFLFVVIFLPVLDLWHVNSNQQGRYLSVWGEDFRFEN